MDSCSTDGSIFGRAHSPNPKLPQSEAASMSRVEDAERLRLQCASNVARSEAGRSSGQYVLATVLATTLNLACSCCLGVLSRIVSVGYVAQKGRGHPGAG